MAGTAVAATLGITLAGFIYTASRIRDLESHRLSQGFAIALITCLFLCFARFVLVQYVLKVLGDTVIQRKEVGRSLKMDKFATCTFKAAYFVCITALEYFVLSDQDFTPSILFGKGQTSNFWTANYSMPEKLSRLFMVSLGYHLHSTVYHCWFVEKRADFGEMLLHHALTLWLMVLSFLEGFSRIGLLVVFLNDASDIFVYLTKSLGDTIYVRWSIVSYGCLVVTYFYFRLLVFPLAILPSLLFESNMSSVALVLYAGFLSLLFLLHVNWFSLLIQIGINIATTGSRRDLIVDRKPN